MSSRLRDPRAAAATAAVAAALVVFAFVGFDVSLTPPALRSKDPAGYVASTRALIDAGVGDGSVRLPLRQQDLSLPNLIAVLSTTSFARLVAARAGVRTSDLQLVVSKSPVTSSAPAPTEDNDGVLLSMTPLSLQPTFSVGARAGRPGVSARVVQAAVTELQQVLGTSGAIAPRADGQPVSVWSQPPAPETRVPASGPTFSTWAEAAGGGLIAYLVTVRLLRRRPRTPLAARIQATAAG